MAFIEWSDQLSGGVLLILKVPFYLHSITEEWQVRFNLPKLAGFSLAGIMESIIARVDRHLRYQIKS